MPSPSTHFRALSPGQEGYPAPLAAVPDAPRIIYVRGDLAPSKGPVVAIVGARAATGHGMATARAMAAELAAGGVLIVSGGAVGIDTAAHRGALDAGGATWAVIVTDTYPWQSRPLYDQVTALLTPFAPGTEPKRWTFARRNRVIAALADVVVVVDASATSGALHTAAAAREYGKRLCAVPGSAGADALIAQGAIPVTRADDVFHGQRAPLPPLPPDGTDEALALQALDDAPCGAESVALRVGLSELRAARALLSLEIDGHALPLPGGQYIRVHQ